MMMARMMVHAVGLAIQRLDELCVNHADQIIERLIRVRYAAEQRNFALAQFLQVQFVCHRQLGDGRQIERGKAHTHADQNGLGGLARDKLSRTFYQKNKQQYYLLHYACCVCHLAV